MLPIIRNLSLSVKISFSFLLAFTINCFGAEHEQSDNGEINATVSEEFVEYPASFFSRYQPDNALDMVRQLPGFLLDDGTSDRGFIGSVGNILINGNYPSAKQDTPSAILTRIPATQVRKIQLIRGQASGIDLQGQSVVANIILSENSEVSIRWLSYIQKSNRGPYKPAVNISLTHSLGDIDYNLGVNIEREANGERGPEYIFDSNGNLLETRFDRERQTGIRILTLTLNTSSRLGGTLFKFNGKVNNHNGPDNRFRTVVNAITNASNDVYFKDSQNRPEVELGLDAEREFSEDFSAKSIFLYSYDDFNLRNYQSISDITGVQTSERIAESVTTTQEGIGRFEFDWNGLEYHSIQLNIEGAFNSVDGALLQTLNTGPGPIEIDVPGANSKVEELRGDFLIKDTWDLNQFIVDIGLGAEISNISQSGDTEQERNFFFLKPQFVATYSPDDKRLTRLQVLREVAQLDFTDFISSTVFEDNDLALGNPDIRPDTTWKLELSHERRFGELGVVKLTGFHHWINDLLDLLPLSDNFEAPGNIGNARKWGIIMESTLPMTWAGLSGARLDLKARWQDSSVIDPVTGEDRVLSATQIGFGGPPGVRFRDNGNKYVFDIAFRQDLEAQRIAWGWDIGTQASRPRFKVNELETFHEGLELNAFIESTRWFGIKVRLEGNNLLNYVETRDRLLYGGRRELSAITSRILRERTPGSRLRLVLSGNF